MDDLRAALTGQKLRELKGLGAKAEEKLLHAVERRAETGKDKRRPIHEAMPIAQEIVAALGALRGVRRVQYCGSLRRLREMVADIDIWLPSIASRSSLVRIAKLSDSCAMPSRQETARYPRAPSAPTRSPRRSQTGCGR